MNEKIKQIDIYKKVRKGWKRKPYTQVHKDKRRKTRQQQKIDLKKET